MRLVPIAVLAVALIAPRNAEAQTNGAEPHPSMPAPPLEPLASAGVGVYTAFRDQAAPLFRVAIEADVAPNGEPSVTSLCPRTRHGLGVECGVDAYLYGRVEATGAISSTGQGIDVALLDVAFHPMEHWLYAPIPSESANVLLFGFQLLPLRGARDLAVDESLRLSVPLVGLAVRDWDPFGSNFAVFVGATLDAPGYKAVKRVSVPTALDAFHLGGAALDASIRWSPSQDFVMALGAGGSADINCDPTRCQSDLAATATVGVDAWDWLQIFVQPRFVDQWDHAHGSVGSAELLGALALAF